MAATVARRAAAAWLALLAQPAFAAPPALPGGGTVAAGQAMIAGAGDRGLVVTQGSDRAVVGWRSFDVGAGHAVSFLQPGPGSAVLNRVTGDTASTIAGSITANGQVFLVNPNGISITPGGTVRAAGFVASTLDVDDADFMAGRLTFRAAGAGARVKNAGSIVASPGGFAALLGGSVSNAGTIEVPLGRVGLGAGERIVLDLQGTGFLQVAMPGSGAGDGPLVEHSGRIAADGGRVQLSAGAALEAARRVVNLSGIVEARTVGGRTGAIVLEGGEGTVRVSGRLDASGQPIAGSPEVSGPGGRITVVGRHVELVGAQLDASGTHGGGALRVGGDVTGGGTLQRAETLTVDAATGLRADATRQGDGGSIVLWSDLATRFDGSLSARASGSGARGGFAEVSSAGWLGFAGSADLRGDGPNFGTLLLDPRNVTISTGTNTSGFSATLDNSVINTTTLQNALATASVVVDTGSSGTQSGDITVANSVAWSSGSTLTLNAARNVVVNAALSATGGGGVALIAGNQVTLASAVSVGAGGGAGVRLTASESIVASSGSSITTQGQAILLNADRDGNGSGGIALSEHAMASNGGAITLGGGAGAITGGSGYAVGNATNVSGVSLSGSSIAAAGGDVTINGRGRATTTSLNHGVLVDAGSAVSTTGTGALHITGVGGGSGNASFNYGVAVTGSTMGSVLSTVDGALSVTGTGGGAGSGATNTGVFVTGAGSALRSSGTGAVAVTGSGGNAGGTGSNNVGVLVRGATASIRSTGTGSLSVTGTGGGTGTGGTNHGLSAVAGSAIAGSGGAMTLTGTAAASGGASNHGINVDASSITNTGMGALSLSGIGNGSGTATTHNGIRLNAAATVSTVDGALTLVGRVDNGTTSTDSGLNSGVVIYGSVVSSVNGAVAVTGTGGGAGTGSRNYGVQVSGATAAIRSTGSGAVSVTGTGGNANGTGAWGDVGVLLETAGRIATTGGGAIAVTGTGAGGAAAGASNSGILVSGGAAIAGSGGAMDIIGTAAAAGGSSNQGIGVSAASITNTGAGTVSVSGFGSARGAANGGVGVALAGGSRIAAVDGALSVRGTGGGGPGASGTFHDGVAIDGGSSIATSGAGAITVIGVAGQGLAGSASGVAVRAVAGIATTGTGAILVQGTRSPDDSGSGVYSSVAGAFAPAPGRSLTLTGDRLTVSGLTLGASLLIVDSSVAADQIGPWRVDTVRLAGSGAVRLMDPANAIGTLYGEAGSVSLVDGSSLTVGAAGAGLRTSGAVRLQSVGADADLVLAASIVSGADGDAVVLAAGRSVTNAAGPDGIVTSRSGARFLVYSNDWEADAVGGLAAGRLYGREFASAGPSTITQPGSRLIYRRQPSLTLTGLDASRAYGDANPEFGFAANGLLPGDSLAGALDAPLAQYSTAGPRSAVGRYAIEVGALASAQGYRVRYVPGELSVTPRAITVAAGDARRVFGAESPAFVFGVGGAGLVDGDTVSGAPDTTAAAGSPIGRYAIARGSLSASGNYALEFVPGTLWVLPAEVPRNTFISLYQTDSPRAALVPATPSAARAPIAIESAAEAAP